ncbi:MAG TPA: serine protease [Fibrobacteria bacterium]|nr:serine protease [Fibrobacteria bacterium]
MRFVRFLAVIMALSLAGHAVAASRSDSTAAASGKRVVVIPVEEEVDAGLHAFLKRATAEALKDKPDVIVYKVNTYGGELHSAFDIVDLLLSVKGAQTYVYVEQKAISAGALISLAANRIAMGDGTTIGDCAPITQSSEGGIVMLGEKIQSPLRAKFRNLAERNGYPSLLSQAMVTSDIGVVEAVPVGGASKDKPLEYFTVREWEVLSDARRAAFESHETLVREGELLTLTDREAEQHGFSQGSFRDFDAFLKQNDFKVVKTIPTNWSEDLARAVGKFTPLLLLIGFGALYLEFKTPGLSVFGAIGAACLAAAFGAKYAVGLADHTELLLLLGGFILLAVEIYVLPGTFIAGLLGLALLLAALTLSLQGFTLPNPDMPWELRSMTDNLALTLGMAALALFIPLLAARYVLPRLSGRASVASGETLRDARAAEELPLRPGDRGLARTAQRPAGKAAFEGIVYEATSSGAFIEAGSPVEVVYARGNEVTVRAVSREEASA